MLLEYLHKDDVDNKMIKKSRKLLGIEKKVKGKKGLKQPIKSWTLFVFNTDYLLAKTLDRKIYFKDTGSL